MPKASAAVVSIVVLASVGSACSGGSSRSSAPPTTVTGADSDAATGQIQTLASVGEVIVRRGRQGIVIRDGRTHGKRFFLSGIQAGECLSYLKANPGAPARDLRAACPGEAVVAMAKKP